MTDGAPALALGVDPADDGLMDQPPRPSGERVITGACGAASCSSARHGGRHAARPRRVTARRLRGGRGRPSLWADDGVPTLMLFQMFNVLNARSDQRSAFVHLFTNRWLWGAVAGSVALQLLVVYVPFLQHAFSTVALTARDWTICVAVASSVLWLREGTKPIGRVRCRFTG